MRHPFPLIGILLLLLAASLACQAVNGLTSTATALPSPTSAPTSLPSIPINPGTENPTEPVFISGEIPFTSPFFLDSVSEAFVMLEDQYGFIQRDWEFEFPLESQVIGPIELIDDDTLTYQLSLPAIPQGNLVDVDNDSDQDAGVLIFAVAYWSNTWGGPFLEARDGIGWSTAYASTTTDADRDHEINGGILIVWAPDDQQGFPSGYGEDQLLFTADDPATPIPAGYSIVDINQEPFEIYKQAEPNIDLIEGDIAVNDFSEMSYSNAFDALYEKISLEYPFTPDKGIDWEKLYQEYAKRISEVRSNLEFFEVLKDFSYQIPDGHVGISFNDMIGRYFFDHYGGSFGLILVELSDGRVLVRDVYPGLPAARAGVEVGAEILKWEDRAIGEAIGEIEPFFGPYSTEHHRRFEQLVFLTRVPENTRVNLTYKNPNGEEKTTALKAEIDYDSIFDWIPSFVVDEISPPVVGEVLEPSGLGYIRINTFSGDYNLTAQLWDHYINRLLDTDVPGLIIDMRVNSGGSTGLSGAFAGYFFDQEFEVSRRSYYNDLLGEFEYKDPIKRIKPGPAYFEGPVAVLVSPYCVSACEGFAYALSLRDDAVVVGHFPTAGAYGEVGRGQFDLPADLSIQFPTGRSETPEGELLIEGTGVVPDTLVPVSEANARGEDTVLETAIQTLLDKIDN
jgi:C-terminal processing protease CtpA/Prc